MFDSIDGESALFALGEGEVVMLDEVALHLPQDVVGAALLGTGCLALSGPR